MVMSVSPSMPGMSRVDFTAHNVLTQWDFSPFSLLALAALVAIGVCYLRADWRLAARGRRWSGRRTASFLAGLVAVDLALQSPVAMFTGTYFQAHVIQHLLLMVIAPPLLAMGAPMTLWLQTANRTTKTTLLSGLNSRWFQVLTHPLIVWFLYYFSMFAFFLTAALGTAMEHMWLMDVINVGFLLGATLFWWPIVGLDPIPHWKMTHGIRMVNLMIGIPVESFLGIALLGDSRPAAPMYTLASTHSGGALLWVGAEIFTFLAFVPIFMQWLRAEERKAARYDQHLDAATEQAATEMVPEMVVYRGGRLVTESAAQDLPAS
jgi:putative copper resistance protein D